MSDDAAAAEEPPTKKVKQTGWEDHTLNISEAVMKADETKHFAELSDSPITTLQGIGPKSAQVIEALKITTVRDLATYKYFLLARAIKNLAAVETKDGRLAETTLNIDKAVDKEWETKSLAEIVDAPVSALEGLTEAADELLKDCHIKTIGELATWKYCCWAEAICLLGDKYEHTKTLAERKEEAALNKLK